MNYDWDSIKAEANSTLRILIVCHCYRVDEDTIRIFSARKATKNETLEYIRRK